MRINSPASRRRLLALVAVGSIALAACGSDGSDADEPTGEPPESPTTDPDPVTTVPAAGGWIGGEPDWGGSVETDDGMGAAVEESSADVALEFEPEPRSDADVDAAAPAPAPDIEPPGDDIIAPPSDEPLRAGSVDDGADFAGFLEYVERVGAAGFTARDVDLSGRVVITVVDDTGRPVPGIALEASVPSQPDLDGAVLRTTADGTARLFPALYGFDPAASIELRYVDIDLEVPVAAEPGSEVTMIAPAAEVGAPVPLDVLFLLDATGSMADEIDRLKRTIDTVADRVNQLDPRPDVRFAMTLYRDEGDAFVTSSFDFTSDVGVFRDALAEVVADGGGDYPEALDEGLAEALAAPAWRDPADAIQLVFLVADAPPQVTRQVASPYTDSIRDAAARGVKVFPIASSESDDVAELVFRQLAVTTGAPFVFLSYGAGGAATGGSTDIDRTDYEELALDELVVRLIAEELADLNGGETTPVPPTTVAPPTTNPEGQ